MRHFSTLLAHELRMLAVSSATYAAGGLFLLVMGAFYYLVLFMYDSAPQVDLPTTQFFQLFWLPVFFVVPLLTMKSLAEERRHGTLEATLTTPASALAVVASKYGAAYLLYAGLWALTLLFPWLANNYLPIGQLDPRLADPVTLFGGFLFVAVSGLLYVALGVFASSLTRSTLVAGMLAFSLLFTVILGGSLLQRLQLQMNDASATLNWLQALLDYFHTFRHLDDFSRGIVDTRAFFLYGSNTLLVLGLTTLVVESRGAA